ncbi:MAG TPA: 3-ketosteroid dehydrogenase, partial [Gammaproteobacteria bacterium]|nr:3-ketosteroid dehydrogenase [Gammaproteobacteria bacterium]
SALAWGEALNAASADLGGYQGHGSWADPHGILITWALMTEGGIQINAGGARFHDESGGYSEAAVAVLAQPGSVAWNLFDDELLSLFYRFEKLPEPDSIPRFLEEAEALLELLQRQ